LEHSSARRVKYRAANAAAHLERSVSRVDDGVDAEFCYVIADNGKGHRKTSLIKHSLGSLVYFLNFSSYSFASASIKSLFFQHFDKGNLKIVIVLFSSLCGTFCPAAAPAYLSKKQQFPLSLLTQYSSFEHLPYMSY